MQMMRARPDVDEDQGPEVDDGEAIGIDRPLGALRDEIIHDGEEAGGQEEADCVMAVPPLGQRILHPGEKRIAFRSRQRNRHGEVVDDMQHRDGDDERQVEPVRHIDMRLFPFPDRTEKNQEINDPDDGEP